MYKSVKVTIQRPKIGFNKSLENVLIKKNIEVKNNSKEKVKIKSILPIQFPIKVLKNGTLILNRQSINNKSKIIKQSKLGEKRIYNIVNNKNINNTTFVTPSIKKFKSVKKVDSKKPNTILKSEFSNIENYSNCTQYKSNINNDFSNIQDYIDSLTVMNITNLTNKLNRLKQIEDKNHKYDFNTYLKNSNGKFDKNICEHKKKITCEDDTEIGQIINTFTIPSHVQIIKKNICDINCTKSKINEKEKDVHHNINKIPLRDKNNYFKFVKSKKVKNEFVTFTSTKILKNTINRSKLPNNTFNKRSIKLKKNIQWMPYAKFKIVSTNKKNMEQLFKTNVKSTIFHTKRKHNNVSVPTSILSRKDNINENNNLIKVSERRTYKKLLSYPEYNSSIYIIKKLKEIQTEKLINITEHLPLMHKHFLHGKISPALDFTPYESVYKDLINLSVDDKPLFRFIQNKNPEPREKDIMPKLSDFYNPKCTEQYFIIMSPTSSKTININTVSDFSISNKIYMWKICRDNF